jgi:hypothetical protein
MGHLAITGFGFPAKWPIIVEEMEDWNQSSMDFEYMENG